MALGLVFAPSNFTIATFTPANVTGLKLWLKADAISSLSNGDPVVTWSDSSGNANDFTQGTAGSRPTYQTGVLNALPVVRFDGTDDSLRCAGTVDTSTAGTIFVVFKATAVTGTDMTLVASCDEASAFLNYWILRCPNATNLRLEYQQRNNDPADGVRGGTTLTATNFYLGMWQSNDTASTIALNGTNESLSVINGADNGDWLGDTSGRDSMTLGTLKANSETQFYTGDIAEVILYNSAISTTDRDNVESYIATKYGLTVA